MVVAPVDCAQIPGVFSFDPTTDMACFGSSDPVGDEAGIGPYAEPGELTNYKEMKPIAPLSYRCQEPAWRSGVAPWEGNAGLWSRRNTVLRRSSRSVSVRLVKCSWIREISVILAR